MTIQETPFLRLARHRRSIRAYLPDPVPEPLLRQVLEAGRAAPSACNKQPWRFIVVRDASRRLALKKAYAGEWAWKAPIIIAVCVLPDEAWTRPHDGQNYALVDGALALDHMTLAAAELGLGTCWIGAFDPRTAQHILEVPEHVRIVGITPLGYPGDEARPAKRPRRPLKESVMPERWQADPG